MNLVVSQSMTAEFQLGQNWANFGRRPLCEVMPDTLMGAGDYLTVVHYLTVSTSSRNQSKSETESYEIFIRSGCSKVQKPVKQIFDDNNIAQSCISV